MSQHMIGPFEICPLLIGSRMKLYFTIYNKTIPSKMILMLQKMLLTAIIITTIISGSIYSLRLTEEIFYKADTLLYTPEFCSSLQATDFLLSIRPTKQSGDYREIKSKAFKTLFDACRGRLLYDATMAKNVIVPMVDTGNTDYLPLLLDQGVIKGPKTKLANHQDSKDKHPVEGKELPYNNLDLSPEIKSLTLHLFGVNISPSPSTNQFFFQVRNPDRALAYLFAFAKIDKEAVEEVRDLLENFKEHVQIGEYVDARSIRRAVRIVDEYLRNPSAIGNHKINLPPSKNTTDDDDDYEDLQISSSTLASLILKGVGIVLGFGTMAAVVLVLWKNQQNSKGAYHTSN